VAQHRGVLTIDTARLHQINELDGPCVYSLFDGQVVEAGETVGHAKIIPFAVSRRTLSQVESILGDAPGVIGVRPFRAHRVAAVVHGSMGERAIRRFREAVAEKLGWFGSALGTLEVTQPTVDSIADAFAAATRGGADVVLVAGTKAMDVLDPTFAALDRIGARMIRHGIPGHPGSLLWLAEWNDMRVVGMPTCGLFAKATVFDLVIARVMTGEPLGRGELASLGHGGFLTRDMAFRLPAYRAAGERGAVE
jgi:molybdopterin biosynthesis enzyme